MSSSVKLMRFLMPTHVDIFCVGTMDLYIVVLVCYFLLAPFLKGKT